ncbi:MAG: DEAD/DEAH box helicase, partial [Burkholderiaceae bacterium]|nr:DEAD/DEAH box helicase [Burkholderiaceae bacterium]
MARNIAPSLWLPGFNPEPPEPSDLLIETEPPTSELAPSMEESSADESVEPARQRVNWRVVSGTAETAIRNLWPQLVHADLHNLGGSVAKFEANLAAIKALRQIDAEDRPATPDERSTLLRYTGWGGLPASFNLEADDAAWAKRARQLSALLTPDEYESARASVNNSHYTEVHVIEAIWQAVQRFGFSGGRILEPAAGIGHFIGAMPTAIAEQSSVTAVEIDQLSGRMLHALYAPGGVDVRISPFEKTALADNWFD